MNWLDDVLAFLHGNQEDGDPAGLLYTRWYAGSAPIDQPPGFPASLVSVLRSADARAEEWEEGWLAVQVGPNGQVVARRDREVRLVFRGDYVVTGRPGLLARQGDPLMVSGRRDIVSPAGDWWYTSGGGWRVDRPPATLVRLYWNITFGHLPELTGRLTGLLGRIRRPWMLKCAADPPAHTRADVTVLYLDPEVAHDLAGPLRDMALDLPVRDSAPRLTLPVAPGLAAAWDPRGGESFGEHRCRLIAAPPHSKAGIVDRFTAAGISVDRPYAHKDDPVLPWEN
ncbi:hypothetical protein GCM10009677_58060 [Sphaerisporangium rubeum]|uniref:Uncharacterized protein n=1 Tax=Sphaerisporangium rubeum TaxID=321317 RepID=A0A7X0III5_9ACTN|nr:T3SS effector HopA1 family protein [Sphaerisporangium rubeum]MBB6474643.1 hypothetical protein [Sphaerisporangium rubeum]